MAEELKRKKEAQFEGKPTTPENEQQTIEAAIQRFLDSKRVRVVVGRIGEEIQGARIRGRQDRLDALVIASWKTQKAASKS